ncbi:hypothetical protein RHMOL_Rhmol13G0237800 [Rhododendron molle]|uniref:Uncharacterized protein n=1 Tax=Rhododendron molle TaxID=49168 RepID=A0ACC0L9Y2_RHOML|nr:hypothetical protein RHMOL_Rhmol13G0237800 [Rhododendron molle]
MASLVLLLSELLKHQTPDPTRHSSSSSSSSSSARVASAAPPYSTANWVAEKSSANSTDICRKEIVIDSVDDFLDSKFCGDLVWP